MIDYIIEIINLPVKMAVVIFTERKDCVDNFMSPPRRVKLIDLLPMHLD